jgi:molybdate transport system ATP-binding protein
MINGDNPKAYGQNIKLFGKRKGSGESVWQIKNLIGYLPLL